MKKSTITILHILHKNQLDGQFQKIFDKNIGKIVLEIIMASIIIRVSGCFFVILFSFNSRTFDVQLVT